MGLWTSQTSVFAWISLFCEKTNKIWYLWESEWSEMKGEWSGYWSLSFLVSKPEILSKEWTGFIHRSASFWLFVPGSFGDNCLWGELSKSRGTCCWLRQGCRVHGWHGQDWFWLYRSWICHSGTATWQWQAKGVQTLGRHGCYQQV